MQTLSKNKILLLLIIAVVFLLFNVIAFAIPFVKHSGFWFAYGFSTLAILLSGRISFHALTHGGRQSKFYGLPLLYVAWIYLGLQLVLGFFFMSFSVALWLNILLNSLLLGACLTGLFAVEIGLTEIGRLDEAVKKKVLFINSLKLEVDTVAAKTTAPALQEALQALAEAIRYSDPMSSPQLSELESAIERQTTALRREVEAENIENARRICEELQQLLAERNKRCKIFK
jgi:hypothetical protein